jgi:hypothetical protein
MKDLLIRLREDKELPICVKKDMICNWIDIYRHKMVTSIQDNQQFEANTKTLDMLEKEYEMY